MPLAVIFAWLMIMIAVRGIIFSPMSRVSGCISILMASSLVTLLDLELEPVAFHLEKYWIWQASGSINYYGVPLFNFMAWFIITFVLLTLVSMLISRTIAFMDITSFSSRLPTLVSPLLYGANILMFGLIDLTHGYYIGVGCAILAGILLIIIAPFPRYSTLAIPLEYGVEQDQAFQPDRKRVKKTKKVRKKKRR
jgi:putative membrane protein